MRRATKHQRILVLEVNWLSCQDLLSTKQYMSVLLSGVLLDGILGSFSSTHQVLFAIDYLFQFYISRNKLDFLYSMMALVDVVTLMPILVFKVVPEP